MDDAALDRFVDTIGTLEGLHARAKDDGYSAALEEVLEPLQSAARV